MNTHRFTNIDGLRAIAALAVFFQHVMGDILRAPGAFGTPLHVVSGVSTSWLDLGRFGVVLFFLISGFVVPFSFGPEAPIRRFALSRLFRLYPALWAALAALTVLFIAEGHPVSLTVLLANMTMAPTLLGEAWMSGIYWTLFIELLFYVLVVMLFATRSLYRPRVLFVVTSVLIGSTLGPVVAQDVLSVHLPVQYVGLHLSFLFSGLMLRLALVEKAPEAGWLALALLAVQVVAATVAGLHSINAGDAFADIGIVPILTAYCLAIAVFVAAARTGWPRSSILAYLGKISYSIYLFHWIVCASVYHLFPLTGQWSDLAIAAYCLALTIGISSLTFRLIEQPSIALGRALLNWGPRTAAAT